MKKTIAIAAILLLAVTAFAQDGKSIYKKYSDAENVSSVYISPAMFRLMGKLPDLNLEEGDVNLSGVVKSLTGMYIINSENQDVNKSLKTDAEKFISKGKYELLMEAKENGETIRMYTMGSEEIVNGFVMLASEKDECTFICLDGQMTRKELEDLIAKSTR